MLKIGLLNIELIEQHAKLSASRVVPCNGKQCISRGFRGSKTVANDPFCALSTGFNFDTSAAVARILFFKGIGEYSLFKSGFDCDNKAFFCCFFETRKDFF